MLIQEVFLLLANWVDVQESYAKFLTTSWFFWIALLSIIFKRIPYWLRFKPFFSIRICEKIVRKFWFFPNFRRIFGARVRENWGHPILGWPQFFMTRIVVTVFLSLTLLIKVAFRVRKTVIPGRFWKIRLFVLFFKIIPRFLAKILTIFVRILWKSISSSPIIKF